MTLLLDTGPLVVAIDRSDKHHVSAISLSVNSHEIAGINIAADLMKRIPLPI